MKKNKKLKKSETGFKTENRRITYNKEDLRNLRFIGNNAALLGDYYLLYPSPEELIDALSSLPCDDTGTFTECVTIAVDPPLTRANLVNETNVRDSFVDALYFFFRDFAQDYNSEIPFDSDIDYPVMLAEIFHLRESLYYAIMDCIPKCTAETIRTLNADKVYDHFIGSLGHWWVINCCGMSEALNLLEDFFNRYFPLLQREIFFKNYTND